MRIIDKRRDYYDCIQRIVQDRNLVYVRNTKEIGKYHNYNYFRSIKDIEIERFIIGFCGKLYAGIKIAHENENDIFYNFLDANEFILDNLSHRDSYDYERNLSPFNQSKRSLYRFFKDYSINYDWLLQKFSFTVPIFVLCEEYFSKEIKLIANPLLNQYKFYKVFDTYRTFQELQMYLGSLAAPLKEIPVLDDITMRDIKGFNKFSFRKDKSK